MVGERGRLCPVCGAALPPCPGRSLTCSHGGLRGGNTGQRRWDDALAPAFSVGGGFPAAGGAWVPLAPRAGWGGGIWGVP